MISKLIAKLLISSALIAALLGCSSAYYKESADNETYELIQSKAPLVSGMTENTTIGLPEFLELTQLPSSGESYDFLAQEAASEVDAKILTLSHALDLAFHQSNDFQTQRERLYLQALSLTFDRYRYTPIFAADGSANYQWDNDDQFVSDMRELTGMDDLSSQTINTSEQVNANTTLGVRYLLRGGGAIALNLTNNFLRFLTGDVSEAGTTALIGSFAQPLLRDFGTAIETENLIQAERSLLYQLRDFTRFRKEFAVRVASDYYSVLLNRETVKNNYLGLQANNLSLERERAFQAEGLTTLLEVGRLEQSSLQADLRWTASITRYKNSLDNFKLLIGLNADERIILDDNEMVLLSETGMESPDLSLEQATELAIQTRLDLYTQLDRVQDAARKIEVAANVLSPALDLNLLASVPSSTSGNLGELDFESTRYTAGLVFELPVDTKLQRNSYRRTLIDYDVATRDYILALDGIKLDVLDAWRRMNQARKSYEINLTSVAINERRVEEAELRAELGLGNIQDTVDSQNDLTAAQSNLVSSIVDHNIAKLEFWRDVGLFYVDDNGEWEEGTSEPR